MYGRVEDAVRAGIGQVERKYITTGLAATFCRLWESGIRQDVPIMNVITWNDYPEGHHLAPEINHNEGFSILLNYYKSRWKKLPSPYAGRDVAIVFFKKYPHSVVPAPYAIPVVPFQKEALSPASEDSIEVVTLLTAAGQVRVNGQPRSVPAGLATRRFASQPGLVTVAVERNTVPAIHFTTPEGITAAPYRADRITYTFSSEFADFYRGLFPGFRPSYSHEYTHKGSGE